MDTDDRLVEAGGRGAEMGGGGQRCKLPAIKSVLGVNVQHGDYGQYHIIYSEVAKRVNHK